MSTQGSITNFFSKTLGAPLSNQRWSWGAVNSNTGQVFLRVWTDERKRIRGKDCITIFGAGWESASLGKPERRKHVELLRTRADGYGVLCTPWDSKKTGKRHILRFDNLRLLQFGPLVNSRGTIYAEIVGQVSIDEIVWRWTASDSLSQDIEAIWATSAGVTTKKALTDARIGQGKFRTQVLRLWDGQCCVSGSQTLDVVRASHIKPWRECTDNERLDPHNGIPLSATFDCLFDVGLITFDGVGGVLIAKTLRKTERALLGVDRLKLKRAPSKRTAEYLQYHRSDIFLDGKNRGVTKS
jgi:putative restriction endonuclease